MNELLLYRTLWMNLINVVNENKSLKITWYVCVCVCVNVQYKIADSGYLGRREVWGGKGGDYIERDKLMSMFSFLC